MNVISFQLDFSTAEAQQMPGSKEAFVLFGESAGQLAPGVYRVICGELYRVLPEQPTMISAAEETRQEQGFVTEDQH